MELAVALSDIHAEDPYSVIAMMSLASAVATKVTAVTDVSPATPPPILAIHPERLSCHYRLNFSVLLSRDTESVFRPLGIPTNRFMNSVTSLLPDGCHRNGLHLKCT